MCFHAYCQLSQQLSMPPSVNDMLFTPQHIRITYIVGIYSRWCEIYVYVAYTHNIEHTYVIWWIGIGGWDFSALWCVVDGDCLFTHATFEPLKKTFPDWCHSPNIPRCTHTLLRNRSSWHSLSSKSMWVKSLCNYCPRKSSQYIKMFDIRMNRIWKIENLLQMSVEGRAT